MESNPLQRVPEWYVSRLYKFTGSEFYKLMTGGRRDMTPDELEKEKKAGGKRKTIDTLFGETALTYIDEKLTEIITNGTSIDYTQFSSVETEWGKYWESYAVEEFCKRTGLTVKEHGFIDISERFGCSPDGETSDNGILEIKCPYKPVLHTKNLRLFSPADLKKVHEGYYIQMQIEMIALKKDFGYFVSYDPRCSPLFQLKILQIPRDEEIIQEILMRKEEALKILNKEMQHLIEICQAA